MQKLLVTEQEQILLEGRPPARKKAGCSTCCTTTPSDTLRPSARAHTIFGVTAEGLALSHGMNPQITKETGRAP
ncbi:hypothetical protein [Streptomyces sp. HF10]|uniref:hypothetical protein n=1 Tax=Streptomyces sp. HF10 TaxID=2692233 RepID=UPI0013171E5D|nr:hypothetical protein [Streptomyces sp. HF10]QHC27528.1 hypothetical protein GR129_00290 [Streptomyces sp. HF10]